MPTTVPLGTGEATPQPPWGCVTEFWPRECGVLMLGQEDPQALGWPRWMAPAWLWSPAGPPTTVNSARSEERTSVCWAKPQMEGFSAAAISLRRLTQGQQVGNDCNNGGETRQLLQSAARTQEGFC